MKEYLSNATVRAEGKTTEFCALEKDTYFSFMKENFAHQYNNILRVEANTYWVYSSDFTKSLNLINI